MGSGASGGVIDGLVCSLLAPAIRSVAQETRQHVSAQNADAGLIYKSLH